jgi:uncharacterized heparinase superfamily protein
MVGGVKTVTVERAETEDGRDYVKANHDGYLSAFGVHHERELTLNAAGSILTGRDRFFAPEDKSPSKGELQASARFHVHPTINLVQTETDSVMLIAPDGETWVFSSPGNEVLIAEDVFFADASGVRSSDQIEVVFSLSEKPEIRWFLSRRP